MRRMLTWVLLLLTGLILVLALVLLIPQTRGALLGWGIRFADEAMPGRLTVGESNWPSLGRLVLDDVLWVTGSAAAPGDTLADVARLDLALDMDALRKKNGRVDSLLLEIRNLDVPAMAAAFEDTAATIRPDSTLTEEPPGEVPFLQPGSLPGMPSVVVAKVDLAVARARLAPGMAVRDLELVGRADAGNAAPATLDVEHVGARFLAALGDTAGAPVLEVSVAELGLGLSLEIPAGGDWSDGEFSGQLAGDFGLPGSASFRPWLPQDFPCEEFGPVTGHLDVAGSYTDPLAKGTLRLDLGSDTWVENGLVAGGVEADIDSMRVHGIQVLTAHLDTLDLALHGLTVAASGDWGSEEAGLDLAVTLADSTLPGLVASLMNPQSRDVWRDTGPVRLDAVAALDRAGPRYTGRLDCGFLLPGSSYFHSWLPEDFPHGEFESVSGNLAVTGAYEAPVARGALHLDLGSSPWMDKGVIAGSAETDLDALREHGLRYLTARLDTLDIDMPGIRVKASGELEPDEVELEFVGQVTDLHLPSQLTGQA
ncbi:MAG: hypothetical protein ABFS42_08265, partial [Candidatus Krumholzibacteriota bacterium]